MKAFTSTQHLSNYSLLFLKFIVAITVFLVLLVLFPNQQTASAQSASYSGHRIDGDALSQMQTFACAQPPGFQTTSFVYALSRPTADVQNRSVTFTLRENIFTCAPSGSSGISNELLSFSVSSGSGGPSTPFFTSQGVSLSYYQESGAKTVGSYTISGLPVNQWTTISWTWRLCSLQTPCQTGSSSLLVFIPAFWDYGINLGTTPASAPRGSTPYPIYDDGTPITVRSTVTNNGNTLGWNYDHLIRWKEGDALTGTWSNISSGHLAGLTAGNSRERSALRTLTNTGTSNRTICFQALVNPRSSQYTSLSRTSEMRCVRVRPPAPEPEPEPENWDYRHTSFTSNLSWGTTTNPTRHHPSTGSISVSNRIRNAGGGDGWVYGHQIQYRMRPPGESWTSWTNSGAWIDGRLNSGSSRTRSTTFSFDNVTINDTVVCFRARINNFTGITPDTVTSTGWRYVGNGTTASGTVRCIRVYIQPPSVSDASADCNRFDYSFSGQPGNTYAARLQELVGGSWQNRGSESTGLSPGEQYDFDLRDYRDFDSKSFRVVVRYTGSMEGINPTESDSQSTGRCAQIVCDDFSFNPTTIMPEEPFGITFSFRIRNDSDTADLTLNSAWTERRDYEVELTGTGLSGNLTASGAVGGNSGNNGPEAIDVEFAGITVTSAGQYSIEATVTGLYPSLLSGGNCNRMVTVSEQPYFTVFGGDVLVDACRLDEDENGEEEEEDAPNSIIRALYRNGDERQGSSAQFAVAAINEVHGFASARMRSSNPEPTKGLTFANDGTGGEGDVAAAADSAYGGGYSAGCWGDFTSIPAGIDELDSTQAFTQSINNGGTYYYNGSLTTQPSNNRFDNQTHLTVYVAGDMTITRNIAYRNTSWGSIADIPSFNLIVSGNIYIDASVSRLDGLYRAGGTIYTCTNGSSPITLANVYDNCANQLTVNGSLAADRIIFNRYADSSLRVDGPGQFVYGPNHDCVGDTSRPVCAAEVINFSPEVFLTTPDASENGQSGLGQIRYDAITSLPPVL